MESDSSDGIDDRLMGQEMKEKRNTLDDTESSASDCQSDELKEMHQRIKTMQKEHEQFKTDVMSDLTKQITEYLTLARGQIAEHMHVTENSLSRKHKRESLSFKSQLSNVRVVEVAEMEKQHQAKIDALIDEHKQAMQALQQRLSIQNTEASYHAEAHHVVQGQLNAAMALLRNNNIAFTPPQINPMQRVDTVVLEAKAVQAQKACDAMQKQLDTAASQLRALTLQLKTIRAEHALELRGRDATIESVTAELASFKSGAEAYVRKKITDEIRAEMMQDHIAEQRKTEDRFRRQSMALIEKNEVELNQRSKTISQQISSIQRAQELALNKRDEEHRRDIERLNAVWEKKLAVVQESLTQLKSPESTAILMDKQSRILQLAAVVQQQQLHQQQQQQQQQQRRLSITRAASNSALPPISPSTPP